MDWLKLLKGVKMVVDTVSNISFVFEFLFNLPFQCKLIMHQMVFSVNISR